MTKMIYIIKIRRKKKYNIKNKDIKSTYNKHINIKPSIYRKNAMYVLN